MSLSTCFCLSVWVDDLRSDLVLFIRNKVVWIVLSSRKRHFQMLFYAHAADMFLQPILDKCVKSEPPTQSVVCRSLSWQSDHGKCTATERHFEEKRLKLERRSPEKCGSRPPPACLVFNPQHSCRFFVFFYFTSFSNLFTAH